MDILFPAISLKKTSILCCVTLCQDIPPDGLGRVGPASTTSRKIATTSRTRARTSSASATRIIACAANYSSAKAEPNKSNKGAANSNNSCLIFITMTSRWVFSYYLRKVSKRMSKSILDGGGKQESLQLLFAADEEDAGVGHAREMLANQPMPL